MGLQIVTGYTGTAHIKSAHDRARNAGTVGTGSYVMKTGNMLAAKMQSANTLRIFDGDLMMQGVHATVEAGTHEDLAIDNGTQGKKRNDIVVARYERLAGEPKTESVTLRVIKGEPSDGAAADPAHTEGDILGGDLVAEMPLYRVPIDGITPGEPVALFKTVPSIAELGDSVYQDTGNVYLYDDKTWGSVSYHAKGGVCTLIINSLGGIPAGSSWTVPKAIPAEFIPDESCYAALCHRQTDHQSQIWIPGKKYENHSLIIYSSLETTDVNTRISGIVSWIY